MNNIWLIHRIMVNQRNHGRMVYSSSKLRPQRQKRYENGDNDWTQLIGGSLFVLGILLTAAFASWGTVKLVLMGLRILGAWG